MIYSQKELILNYLTKCLYPTLDLKSWKMLFHFIGKATLDEDIFYYNNFENQKQ